MIGVGIGKGFLVYQPLWIVEFVQEKAIWCTNRLESWVLYRKRLSGVPTALNRGVGTGKGRLVYQLHWIVELVQEKAVWCTNALNRGFCTGKGFLVYQPPWVVGFVQEKAVWCTNALNRGFGTGKGRLVYQRLESWIWYRKRPSGVPTPWIVDFGQLRLFWSTKLSDWKIWLRLSLRSLRLLKWLVKV